MRGRKRGAMMGRSVFVVLLVALLGGCQSIGDLLPLPGEEGVALAEDACRNWIVFAEVANQQATWKRVEDPEACRRLLLLAEGKRPPYFERALERTCRETREFVLKRLNAWDCARYIGDFSEDNKGDFLQLTLPLTCMELASTNGVFPDRAFCVVAPEDLEQDKDILALAITLWMRFGNAGSTHHCGDDQQIADERVAHLYDRVVGSVVSSDQLDARLERAGFQCGPTNGGAPPDRFCSAVGGGYSVAEQRPNRKLPVYGAVAGLSFGIGYSTKPDRKTISETCLEFSGVGWQTF